MDGEIREQPMQQRWTFPPDRLGRGIGRYYSRWDMDRATQQEPKEGRADRDEQL